MEKKNQLRSCCKNSLSSREVVARDLPHPMPLSLLNRKQQPYFMREAEDPAQKPCGMTNFFNNGNICPTLYSVQKHYGMTSEADRFSRSVIPQGFYAGYSERNVKAFTLIELLVVVLIIGILAAVALPQYQRAIDKSRFMTYIQVLHGIKRAQETYYLANSFYAPDLTALDVDYTAGCTATAQGKNMWTCPHGFYIDLAMGNDVAKGAVSVSLCPGHNTSYESCRDNNHAYYHIYFDHYFDATKRGKTQCSSRTARGEAICKVLP